MINISPIGRSCTLEERIEFSEIDKVFSVYKNCYFSRMDLFHISRFLSSGSHHSWVSLKSSEWESTANIFFAFPFAQIAKEKLHDSVFMTFNQRGKKLRDWYRQSEERTVSNLPIYHPSHRRCIRNTFALALTSIFVIWCKGDLIHSIVL